MLLERWICRIIERSFLQSAHGGIFIRPIERVSCFRREYMRAPFVKAESATQLPTKIATERPFKIAMAQGDGYVTLRREKIVTSDHSRNAFKNTSANAWLERHACKFRMPVT